MVVTGDDSFVCTLCRFLDSVELGHFFFMGNTENFIKPKKSELHLESELS